MELEILEENNEQTNEKIEKNSEILEKNMEKKENIAIYILKLAGLQLEDVSELTGCLIPRDLLLSSSKYEIIREHLNKLKGKDSFSSSYLTSLHKDADKKQKWPLLNLVRQILKVKNYRMKPVRKSAGKTKDGKKKYIRYFMIEKYREITKCNEKQEN